MRAAFATGALAAGGTLGILIPPSIPLIIYAIMVEGNIVQLFQAAFAAGHPGHHRLPASSSPSWCASTRRPGRPATAGERRRSAGAALRDIWTVGLIFAVVMGGIYSGIFTPTEGAGIGAVGMFLVAVFYGGMRLARLHRDACSRPR